MGGDEFCLLFRSPSAREQAPAQAGVAAPSEHGPDYQIGAAHGEVVIPVEACEPTTVLRLADQRLYRRKDQTREGGAARQPRASAGGRLEPAVVTAFAETGAADASPAGITPRGQPT